MLGALQRRARMAPDSTANGARSLYFGQVVSRTMRAIS
jgi:hypothetical protein